MHYVLVFIQLILLNLDTFKQLINIFVCLYEHRFVKADSSTVLVDRVW